MREFIHKLSYTHQNTGTLNISKKVHKKPMTTARVAQYLHAEEDDGHDDGDGNHDDDDGHDHGDNHDDMKQPNGTTYQNLNSGSLRMKGRNSSSLLVVGSCPSSPLWVSSSSSTSLLA